MGQALDEHIEARKAASENTETTETTETTEETQEQTTQTTETTEETVETTETTEETTETTEAQVDDLNDEQLNKFFDTTGKTKDDLKSTFAQGAQFSEIKGKHDAVTQELETLKVSNAELKKGLDPLSYFSSEETYVAEQLRKKYPTMDAVAIQSAVTRDLTQMGDLEVLALLDVIKHPGAAGGEAMAKRIIADDFGVDSSEPVDQWDEMGRAKVQRAAIDARNELSTFKNEVELPATKSEADLTTERAKAAEDLMTSWNPAFSKLSSGFDKITIPGKEEGQTLFEFEVPQSHRDGLDNYFQDLITKTGIEPGEESVSMLITQRNKDFIYKNIGTILQAFDADLRSKLTEQTDADLNNTDPGNTATKPAEETTESGAETFLSKQPNRRRRT